MDWPVPTLELCKLYWGAENLFVPIFFASRILSMFAFFFLRAAMQSSRPMSEESAIVFLDLGSDPLEYNLGTIC